MSALNVWILQTGEPLHIDSGDRRPMRAMNLSDALAASGHHVTLWSSGFYHQEKRHRSRRAERIVVSDHLEIRLIPSPGYRRNIGLGRLYDHAVMAQSLRRLLRSERDRPDVAFVGFPPIEAAAVMTRWLRQRSVPTMLDIKDQWPSLFLDPLPNPLKPVGRVALSPYFALARRAMRDATGVCAMTDPFVDWALDIAGRSRNHADRVAPLTSAPRAVTPDELQHARSWWDEQGVTANGKVFRVMFVGSHMVSAFDFEPVRAAARASLEANTRVEFVLCGGGDGSPQLRDMMSGLPNVRFPGWVNVPQILALCERSHAAVVPYRNIDNYTVNLPNKVVDSLSWGMPILSGLDGELATLLSEHHVGLHYTNDVGDTLYDRIRDLAGDPAARVQMSANARALYADRFSYENVYGGLVKHLEGLAARSREG